jgi:hypothetical protein
VWLGLVLGVSACRAAQPSTGPGFDAARVAPPSRDARIAEGTRWLDVDDRDLEGLRDTMRRTFAAGADGVTGELTWGFEGNTDEFDPRTALALERERSRSSPTPLADSPTLPEQLEGLLSEPTLARLLAPAADPIGFPSSRSGSVFPTALPSAERCAPGDDDAGETFSRLNLRLDAGAIALRWEPSDLADQAPLRTLPVLDIELPFGIDLGFRRGSFEDVTLRPRGAQATFIARVQPRPCRDGLATGVVGSGGDARAVTACASDGLTYLRDAQTFLVGPDGPDLAAPRQGLELAVAGAGSASARFVPSGRCVPVVGALLATLGSQLGAFLGSIIPGVGTGVGGFVGIAVGFFAAPFVCDVLASTASRRLSEGLTCALRDVERLATIAVNPPTLRPSLETVLFATGADRNGDGTLSRAEVRDGLAPFGLDASAAALLTPVIDRVDVAIGAEGVTLDEDGTERRLPFSDVDGALLDGAYTTIARGGRVELKTALADFRRLVLGCTRTPEAERDVRLRDFCGLCALAGCPPGDTSVSPTERCHEACIGGVLRDASGALLPREIPAGTAGATIDLRTPAPTVATLLSGAPLFAEELRDYFARPLPSSGRYVRTDVRTASGRTTVSLGYVDDADGDLFDVLFDNCPGVPNPDQADDGDGDTLGAACDLCPGVRSDGRGNEDPDGDGLGAACDCDADGDGCFNPATTLDGRPCAAPGPGRTFDRSPLRTAASDFDGDGIPDDCDADTDGDGVDDEADSCPFGDGDALFEPGIDDVHDDTDSGGLPAADLCDPLCGAAGPPVCRAPIEGLFGFERAFPGRFGRFECIGSGGCQVGAFVECLGQQVGRCSSAGFDRVRLTDGLGRDAAVLDASALGLDAGFGERLAEIADLDGDRLRDWAVGLPRAATAGCGGQQGCPAAGAVALLSGRTLAPLAVLAGDRPGGLLGSSLAFDGRHLAVGAPGTSARGTFTGSVALYDLTPGGAALVATYDGTAALEAMGSDVLAIPGRGFVVGAPGAQQGRGRLVVLDARGVRASWLGPEPGAGLSRATRVEREGTIEIAAAVVTSAGSGVIRYDLLGRELGRALGPAADQLGAALLGTADGALLAGAPGALGGRGAVYAIAPDGTRTLLASGYGGTGSWLGEVTGTGLDTRSEVYVGTADYGGPGVLTLPRTRRAPPGGGGDPR